MKKPLVRLTLPMLLLGATIAVPAFASPDHDHDHAATPASTQPAESPKEAAHDHKDGHDHDNPSPTEKHDDHGDAHVDEVTLTPAAIKQYGVALGTAQRRSITNSFVAPARVAFNTDAMAHVGSAVTGRVTELKIKLGDEVRKGDVLLIVDSPELGEAQSDYLLKRTAVDTARPAVQLARDAFGRARQLHEQEQGIALAEVQKREAELRTAEGAVRAAEAAATAAENKLHLYGMSHEAVAQLVASGEIVPQYRVTAPLAGQIIEREVTLGELVRPDRDALLIVADLATLWVIADVPEARIGELGKGSMALITAAAMKNASIEGRVTYVAPALDPNTRSAKARIEVKDAAGLLKPGMFAQATLMSAGDGVGGVLAIPEAAVQTVEGGPAVFVPVTGEPGTFAKRPVKIGPPAAGMVRVFEGLAEGESLVVSGSFILKAELGKAGAAHQH